MAFDSLGATQKAGQAYQSALNLAAAQRTRIETQFGINDNGTMNNTEAGRLGSIYQTNKANVAGIGQAESADRRRGFSTAVGLGGKMQTQARAGAMHDQALQVGAATGALSENTGMKAAADQEYINEVGSDGMGGNIGRARAFDLSQTLSDNPILGDPTSQSPQSPLSAPGAPGFSPAAKRLALQRNPRIMQTYRNRY